jgi:hypothetical protein
MRTATNYYIMNLSFADLLVACFPIWIHIVDDVTEGWVVGEYFCKFNPFIQSKYIFVDYFSHIFHKLLKAEERVKGIILNTKERQ